MMGSCFTQNIGARLKYFGFSLLENPYGITFNPLSLAGQLHEIIDQKEYHASDLTMHGGRLHSLQHHSFFSGSNEQDVLQSINDHIASAYVFLKDTDVLFVSLGTAYVWNYLPQEIYVNNCHKIPSGKFRLDLLKTGRITELMKHALTELQAFNPKIRIVFTVSPVRHARNGMIENSRSKAILIETVHQLCEDFDQVHYFPSYEIMMDDLRDYRFYEDDLLHPSVGAIDYIWEKFSETYFEKRTFQLLEKVQKVRAFSLHRPQQQDLEEKEKHAIKVNEMVHHLFRETGIDLKTT